MVGGWFKAVDGHVAASPADLVQHFAWLVDICSVLTLKRRIPGVGFHSLACRSCKLRAGQGDGCV